MFRKILHNNFLLLVIIFAFAFVAFGGFNQIDAQTLPTEEDVIPAGCVDVDGSGDLNEIDCGSPQNDSCSACGGGSTEDENEVGNGAGTGAGTEGEIDWTGVDLTIQDVADIINGLACWLIRVIFAVMVIFLILAGLRFMAAQGDPAKLTTAKKNLTQVLIGIVVIMAVYVIIATIANAVGSDFSFVPLVC